MKKKYTLPTSISTEIGSTLDLVKNNIGTLNYKIVPISAIEFDPNNPRELAITRDDLISNISPDDPLYERKMKELSSLKQISETIRKYGVRNAVEIYKFGNSYRLIHGERRCLSSILAGKKEIPAKVLDEKPTDFDIRLLQLIENIQREDLTLYETLNNIRHVINEYKNHIDSDLTLDTGFLENLINCSRTHCANYLAVLNAPDDLQDLIKIGKIRSLEKAALIAKAKTQTQKDAILERCLNGVSLKQLKKEVAVSKISISSPLTHGKPRGKISSKVKLGTTQNKKVIDKIITLVLNDPLYSKFRDQFNKKIPDGYVEYSKLFSSFIRLMEKIEID